LEIKKLIEYEKENEQKVLELLEKSRKETENYNKLLKEMV